VPCSEKQRFYSELDLLRHSSEFGLSFVHLSIGNSKLNYLGAQGTINPGAVWSSLANSLRRMPQLVKSDLNTAVLQGAVCAYEIRLRSSCSEIDDTHRPNLLRCLSSSNLEQESYLALQGTLNLSSSNLEQESYLALQGTLNPTRVSPMPIYVSPPSPVDPQALCGLLWPTLHIVCRCAKQQQKQHLLHTPVNSVNTPCVYLLIK